MCISLPGTNVNKPASSSAPAKIEIIVIRWARTLCRRAASTPTTSMMGANTDSRWIGLHGPHSRMPWIRNDDPLITEHQHDPHPAERPVRQRAFGRGELDRAEGEGGHRGESVDLNFGRGVQQRCERHRILPGGLCQDDDAAANHIM